jgi:hypothetical protein
MSKSTEKTGDPASPHHELELPPSYYESAEHYSPTQTEDARNTLVETQYAAPSTNERQTVGQQQADGPPGAQPPPAYTDQYGTIDISEGGMDTKAVLTGLLHSISSFLCLRIDLLSGTGVINRRRSYQYQNHSGCIASAVEHIKSGTALAMGKDSEGA